MVPSGVLCTVTKKGCVVAMSHTERGVPCAVCLQAAIAAGPVVPTVSALVLPDCLAVISGVRLIPSLQPVAVVVDPAEVFHAYRTLYWQYSLYEQTVAAI